MPRYQERSLVQADGVVEIRDFRGMMSNVDPTDMPPGASQVQVNVSSVTLGKLETRGGLRELTYDST